MKLFLLSLLALVTLTSSAFAEETSRSFGSDLIGGGSDRLPMYYVEAGAHIVIDSVGDGLHRCQLLENGDRSRAVSAGHDCHLSYTVPSDGKDHSFVLLLTNSEDYHYHVETIAHGLPKLPF